VTIRIVSVAVICIFLSGCVLYKTMKGSFTSQIDPDYLFSYDKRIAVMASKSGNTLVTKYYVNHIISLLKEKGFKEVYSYREVPKLGLPFDIALIVDVSKKTDTYEYEGANYGMVDSGNSTVTCSGWGNSINCNERKQQTIGVTGYSKKTGVVTGYFFNAHWYSVESEQKIMYNFASSFEKGCSDRGVYEFIIEQTVHRMDFSRPNDYKYSVKMPPEYICNY